MQYVTPLRYPGGKGRLTQTVIDILRANNLVGGHYVEPYAGGAAIALSLLTLEYASHVHINDLNRSIHAFWKSVLEETDDLCRLISSKRISMAEWRRQRAVQSDPDASTLELAYSTFYLNRCNRSGIILGGVIGGKDQQGPWKIDARFNKKELMARVEWIATLNHRITLHNLDAAALIDTVLPTIPRRSLIYLDPPYYVKGKGLYEDHYQHQDHAVIAEKVKLLAHPWIVSYDNTPQIREIYTGVRHKTFGLRYSAQARYEGSEIMFFSDQLTIPDEIVPSRAHAA
jgi:DNA adenine methylase